jgi:Protein of unknown function (DUF2911)
MIRRHWISLSAALFAAGSFAIGQTTTKATTPAATATSATTAPAAPAAARRAPSPSGTAATQVGVTWSAPDKDGERRPTGGKWIEVTYSRPVLRGRTNIFGAGADYGKQVNGGAPVWRAGANQTTKLKTEVPLEIGGKKIPAGEYDLFVDLKENGWTLILSTQPTQEKYDASDKARIWGSYGYDTKYDVARVPMTMLKTTMSHDQFTIAFADGTDTGGKLVLAWEKTAAAVPFTVSQ